ncbi:O(6)-methylguanine-induced apoptosis 2 isoform X2 [Pleuronectes platessa]|uniref:O(6)-methylguanine-induced apoptosis 2 isoform X2 n=1 Tax=Pleuronectes platessa TaxID=8262 RepID=UPI00232A1A64|nr:O(6)-methylguanine-induced apoptosis 2 isoform X2 [Pleuronectes platessa]
MAQQVNQLDRERFCCSICLDLLKDPVTTGCGHSYCRSCINNHWDKGEERGSYSCPQCRQTFTPRPVLVKSAMLADLVEELKKTGLQAAPADHCYAGPEDVACDVCTGRKLKALKSCLVCLASYCENHLQPHLQSAPFKKHKLVEPSEKLQENICSRHDEVMKIFCRTDQQCICYLCSMDEHKDHDTVSAAAEWTERQRELGLRRQTIQQRVQDTEKDVKLLQQEEEAINGSADKAVKDTEEIFTELIRLLEKRSSDVKQQIRSQQETEVSRVRELQEKLEQEITELKRKDHELKQLSDTEDHNQFLHNYPSLSPLSGSTHSSSIRIRPLRYFEDVTAAVSQGSGGYSNPQRNIPGPNVYNTQSSFINKYDFSSGVSRAFRRPLAVQPVGPKQRTPAPNQYDVSCGSRDRFSSVVGTSAFLSKTGRDSFYPDKNLPSPCHYEVNNYRIQHGSKVVLSPFRSKTQRIPALVDKHVPGPGAYSPHRAPTPVKKTLLPRGCHLAKSEPALAVAKDPPLPGPGQYDIQNPDATSRHPMLTAAFASRTERLPQYFSTEVKPGPGFYDPQILAKHSFFYNDSRVWLPV